MAMALRPIDNALPTTPERPKKQAKVSIPIQKQSDPGVNDENAAPLPVADVTIDYVPSENLKPIPDPESKFKNLIEEVNSKDWIKVCESLNDVRRFSLFHSSLLVPILEKVIVVVVKAMKNPRSALCKTSIMASTDFFSAFGEKLLEIPNSDPFNQLLLQLLLKASQDKKFVCEEADNALTAMVKSMAPLLLLEKLRGYVSHGNLKVRAKAANSISNCVSKMGLEEMKEFGLVPLLLIGAGMLNDKLPEAREAARRIVISVHKAFVEKEEEKVEAWEGFCQMNLSSVHAQAMLKVVSSSQ